MTLEQLRAHERAEGWDPPDWWLRGALAMSAHEGIPPSILFGRAEDLLRWRLARRFKPC